MGEIVQLRGKIPEVGKDPGRGDEAQSIPMNRCGSQPAALYHST